MTGSLGMLASTVPVQMLLPMLGWRGLFWALAGLVVFSVGVIQFVVPATHRAGAEAADSQPSLSSLASYRSVLAHPLFRQLAPMGFVIYGGMIAVQALWAGPWLTRVVGLSPQDAARGLFFINACMLLAFMSWGALMPRLAARGFHAVRLVRLGVPLSLLLLALNIALGEHAGPLCWALWCVACTFITPSQPAIGMAFSTQMAGRALSAFNLVIFGGVFVIQWGIGLLIDVLRADGVPEVLSMRLAMTALLGLSVAAYLWGLRSFGAPLHRARAMAPR
jgi:predicted MFS family arabinose efflux permease